MSVCNSYTRKLVRARDEAQAAGTGLSTKTQPINLKRVLEESSSDSSLQPLRYDGKDELLKMSGIIPELKMGTCLTKKQAANFMAFLAHYFGKPPRDGNHDFDLFQSAQHLH
ncbi:uncharacterized protein A4U43_C02F15650 [Asparagus officinalis]|uniref:Uncharacterized protein n=1 Tax=Asparagus officinalis TaxID=4686 RepID=A0A5P1FLB5_ASPOF|nr:uncharacterized protein A4U43_C02F15650 [Asparagus officinalis]